MVKITRALVAGILVAAAAVTLRAEILEQIIVKVNGEIVTKTDFEQRQVSALRARNMQTQGAAPDQLKQAVAEVTPSLIVDAVDELLLLQRGKDLKYSLSDEQFKNIVDNIRKENKLEDDQAFQAALKSEGMTTADLRRSLEKNMIISRVQGTEVMGKVAISEEEARKYHADHIADFTKPGTVTLREIFVAVPCGSQRAQRGDRRADEGNRRGTSHAGARRRIVREDGDRDVHCSLAIQRRPHRAHERSGTRASAA